MLWGRAIQRATGCSLICVNARALFTSWWHCTDGLLLTIVILLTILIWGNYGQLPLAINVREIHRVNARQLPMLRVGLVSVAWLLERSCVSLKTVTSPRFSAHWCLWFELFVCSARCLECQCRWAEAQCSSFNDLSQVWSGSISKQIRHDFASN